MPANYTSKRNPAYVGVVDGNGNLIGTASNPLVTSSASGQGSATPEKVLASETFQSSASSNVQTGTMPDHSDATTSINGQPVPVSGGLEVFPTEGYYNGTSAKVMIPDSDFVAGNIKAGIDLYGRTGTFTADANATAADIKAGKTAYVNGVKITGTAP